MPKVFATPADRDEMLRSPPHERASEYYGEFLLDVLRQLRCLESHARWGSPKDKDLAESLDEANLAILEVHNNLVGVENW